MKPDATWFLLFFGLSFTQQTNNHFSSHLITSLSVSSWHLFLHQIICIKVKKKNLKEEHLNVKLALNKCMPQSLLKVWESGAQAVFCIQTVMHIEFLIRKWFFKQWCVFNYRIGLKKSNWMQNQIYWKWNKTTLHLMRHIAANHSGNQTIPLVCYMHLITHNIWPPARHAKMFSFVEIKPSKPAHSCH